MSNFKNIEKLGIDLLYAYQCDRKVTVIYAENLEALLQSAKVVYGSPDTPSDQLAWSCTQLDCDTHKAILLNIEPVKNKTKAEAALEFMQMFVEQKTTWHSQQAWEEAKRILEMKDEV